MDEEILKIYTIVLENGTRIEDLTLNGNNFVSKTKIEPEIFDRNLGQVTISDGETIEEHFNMQLIQITQMKDEWWFILRDIPEDEIKNAKLRADVDFIAMMTDVEI